MPYYRRRGYRRYGRNYRGKAKAKGWWKNKVAKKGKGDTGLRFFKLRKVFEVPIDSNGGFTSYSSLRNPEKVFDGTNTVEDWSNCSALFDSYRVHAHKFKWIPSFIDNNVGSSLFVSYKPIYVFTDYDNAATGMPVSTVGGVMQYENAKTFNMNRPWKHYVRVPKTLNGNGADFSGHSDIGAPQDQGVHCIYAPNVGTGLSSGTIVGTIVVTYYCSFKNRR